MDWKIRSAQKIEAFLNLLDSPAPGSNDELVGYYYRWSSWRAFFMAMCIGGLVTLWVGMLFE